jgi:hypothetical protein
MPYIMFYNRTTQLPLNTVGQTSVPNGTPLDVYASQLGIIAMSMDRFPGVQIIQVTLAPEKP